MYLPFQLQPTENDYWIGPRTAYKELLDSYSLWLSANRATQKQLWLLSFVLPYQSSTVLSLTYLADWANSVSKGKSKWDVCTFAQHRVLCEGKDSKLSAIFSAIVSDEEADMEIRPLIPFLKRCLAKPITERVSIIAEMCSRNTIPRATLKGTV